MHTPTRPKLISSLLFLVVSLLVIALACFAYWMSTETHNVQYAKDYDWFGHHACPSNHQKDLQTRLNPSSLRPDEDLLWLNHVEAINRQAKEQFTEISSYDLDLANATRKDLLDTLTNSESHYRVEVRRTIREIEAKHLIYVHPISNSERIYHLLDSAGITYYYGCMTGYPAVDRAHDCGRTDTLVWYIERHLLPAECKKQIKLSAA